jgi:hydrogenase maturation protease
MTGTLVLGVGNTLRADEGAGVHAMNFLKRQYELRDARFVDGGTLSFTLAGEIADANNLIVFDAAELHAEPGHVRVFEDSEFDEFLSSGVLSVHEVGFADLMDIARLQDSLPTHYALVAIQPENLGWGHTPGEKVSAALPEAAARAAELIDSWAAADPGTDECK